MNLEPHLDASTSPPGSVLSYKNLGYSIKRKVGQRQVIDDVSVDIRAGELFELAIMVFRFIRIHQFFLIILPGTIQSGSVTHQSNSPSSLLIPTSAKNTLLDLMSSSKTLRQGRSVSIRVVEWQMAAYYFTYRIQVLNEQVVDVSLMQKTAKFVEQEAGVSGIFTILELITYALHLQ